MAEEYARENQSCVNEAANGVGVHGDHATETKDRGLFDFGGKKEEIKPPHRGEQVIHAQVDALKVDEEKRDEEGGEKKKEGFLERLHRSNSSSSSSSDEDEAGEGEEKKKKKEKKGLKEKIKEKITGEKREEHEADNVVPAEKCGDAVHSSELSGEAGENKKGFIENIKEKLHGHDEQKKYEDPHPAVDACSQEEETKEKKGIFEKIKEKLPGYHPKSDEDKEKEAHGSY